VLPLPDEVDKAIESGFDLGKEVLSALFSAAKELISTLLKVLPDVFKGVFSGFRESK